MTIGDAVLAVVGGLIGYVGGGTLWRRVRRSPRRTKAGYLYSGSFHFTDEEENEYGDAVLWAHSFPTPAPGMFWRPKQRQIGVGSPGGPPLVASIGDWLVRLEDGEIIVVSDRLYHSVYAPLDR
jgi:hypothetical protein